MSFLKRRSNVFFNVLTSLSRPDVPLHCTAWRGEKEQKNCSKKDRKTPKSLPYKLPRIKRNRSGVDFTSNFGIAYMCRVHGAEGLLLEFQVSWKWNNGSNAWSMSITEKGLKWIKFNYFWEVTGSRSFRKCSGGKWVEIKTCYNMFLTLQFCFFAELRSVQKLFMKYFTDGCILSKMQIT